MVMVYQCDKCGRIPEKDGEGEISPSLVLDIKDNISKETTYLALCSTCKESFEQWRKYKW